jgi:hypothetical protein
MIRLTVILLFFVIVKDIKAQYVQEDSLRKYSNPLEQEKVFTAQASVLQLSTIQQMPFKSLNYYYANKAIGILKNDARSWYSRGMELKSIKKEHAGKMKQLLTPQQYSLWEKERETNGLVKRIML